MTNFFVDKLQKSGEPFVSVTVYSDTKVFANFFNVFAEHYKLGVRARLNTTIWKIFLVNKEGETIIRLDELGKKAIELEKLDGRSLWNEFQVEYNLKVSSNFWK